jgi:cysteine synthase B
VRPATRSAGRDILDAIGNTPLVELRSFSPNPRVRLFAKLEGHNPTGSVKDRIARFMVEAAAADRRLKPGGTIIEPTSGNTGIALAMVARVRGYKIKVVMPASVSPERVELLKAYGAEIVFSDADKGTNESILVARGIAEENPTYFMPYQYGNEANPRAHFETTGPEIVRDLPDVDVFVAGLGTGGTLMGVGRALRAHSRKVKVIAVAPPPDDVVQGLRSLEHGFVPPILNLDELDGRMLISQEESFSTTKRLLLDEGIFAGVSSGAVVACAQKVAARMERGNVVCLLADGGWKYLSTGLWAREYADLKGEVAGKIWW